MTQRTKHIVGQAILTLAVMACFLTIVIRSHPDVVSTLAILGLAWLMGVGTRRAERFPQ